MALPRRKLQLGSYIGKTSRYLENRLKKHNSAVTSAVYLQSISNKHSSLYLSLQNKRP